MTFSNRRATSPSPTSRITETPYTKNVLGNHPDGGSAPPFYGMRLDELFDVTGNLDRFTVDFEAPGALVMLDFDSFEDSIGRMTQLSESVRQAVQERARLAFEELDAATE